MAESENDVLHVVGGKPLNGTIKVRGGGRTSCFPVPGRVPVFERPPGHSLANC